ncbi:MAG: SDR family NAD(P)-dependent oxidoreductase [Oscillospiraceae bacterium]|nr:SDR family NAD(P)-dependent oxidoreductase [Oscillospiraceae bacterium]
MSVALVTGASSGLGRELAKQLCTHFPQVDEIWLLARRAERLEEVKAGLPASLQIFCLPLDLSGSEGWKSLADALAYRKPEVSLLINCAGVGRMDNLAESDIATQVNMVNLNVAGLTAVTTEVLPYMQKGGRILNLSSIASFCPNPRMTVYSATKAYVSFFSRGLGDELRDSGIKVTAVCPGPMDTEFLPIAAIDSPTFDRLPHLAPEQVAAGALKASAKGKAVYTPGGFFKFFRVVAKLVPQRFMIYLTRT